MGGTSVPTLSAQIAANGHESVGAEAPPTRAGRDAARLRPIHRQATRRRDVVSKLSREGL
ncbi:DUF6053 domain-containing protein [Lysobacter yananisis]|uniref:DUF6053 domain-containing protein n=1 Tax=Lysobacter yananisis TaxID=1003114 RepID=UPI003CE5A426